jgi:hypothetical protein
VVYGVPSLGLPATLVEEIGLKIKTFITLLLGTDVNKATSKAAPLLLGKEANLEVMNAIITCTTQSFYSSNKF